MTTELLTAAEVRKLVQTALSDDDLQVIVDREDREIVKRFGAHYHETGETPDAVTETVESNNVRNLYLRRCLASVSAITEDDVALAAASYRVWGSQGRIERLPAGSTWGDVVAITYVPADDNDTRKAVLVELTRIAVERTAMKSESVGGEYSYTAPDWEALRSQQLNRLALW